MIDDYGTTIETKSSVTERNRLIENNRFLSTSGMPTIFKSRKKRSSSLEHVVELMVVADKKMAEYHGDKLQNYILTLMSIVIVF